MAYRDAFESCPRCGVALEDAGNVRACTVCRGQWVDEAVLAEMVMAMLPAGVLGGLPLAPAAQREHATACPACGVPMEAAILYGVQLERCPKDHGVWFDPDELQTSLLRSAENPPVGGAAAIRDTLDRLVPQPLIWLNTEPAAAPSKPQAVPAPPAKPRSTAPPIITDEIVSRMKTGVQFRVGRDLYWWDAANDALMVTSKGRSHAIGQEQWNQVVVSHPEAFTGTPALLAEVIARMKRGEEVVRGGGRIFDIYGWDPKTKQLYVESVVDGDRSRGALSESELAEAIAESPSLFTK